MSCRSVLAWVKPETPVLHGPHLSCIVRLWSSALTWECCQLSYCWRLSNKTGCWETDFRTKILYLSPCVLHSFLVNDWILFLIMRLDTSKCRIGHFTVVCLVTWQWMQARLEVTLLWYRSLCFSHVNVN